MVFFLPDRQEEGRGKEDNFMLRSMDSAVAGLRAHQNKMDVVGHNIANVNTFGFKAQTYTFKEAMYQTSSASTGGSGGAGGTNAAQYGYGTLMGSIGMDMTGSTPSYVGGFNASIDGEGFFITSPALKSTGISASDPDAIKAADFSYTRVGQFMVDNNGYIVDTNGNFIYGFRAAGDGTTGTTLEALRLPDVMTLDGNGDLPTSFSYSATTASGVSLSTTIEINSLGKIMATVKVKPNGASATDPATETRTIEIGQVALATFQNPNGLAKVGGNYYQTTANDNAGQVAASKPGEGGTASLMTGYIEASNVDLAKEFSDMIMTQRGFQANSKMITVGDEMLQELVNMKR
jgi:flagellar hook protein FlgE